MGGGLQMMYDPQHHLYYPSHGLLFFSFHTILSMAADQLIEKMSHWHWHCTGAPFTQTHTLCIYRKKECKEVKSSSSSLLTWCIILDMAFYSFAFIPFFPWLQIKLLRRCATALACPFQTNKHIVYSYKRNT